MELPWTYIDYRSQTLEDFNSVFNADEDWSFLELTTVYIYVSNCFISVGKVPGWCQ